MRRLQPKGPYYLCGMCVGAYIAFEMACQLIAQGEKIGFGVFDSWADGKNKARYAWHMHYYLSKIKRFLKMKVGEKLKSLQWRRKWLFDKLTKTARKVYGKDKRGEYLNGNGQEDEVAVIEGAGSGQQFRLPNYLGRIALFKARKQPFWRPRNRYSCWEIRTGGVDLHLVPGKHFGLLRERTVQITAHKLYRYLP
jgi:thioesterase domain-containing protein